MASPSAVPGIGTAQFDWNATGGRTRMMMSASVLRTCALFVCNIRYARAGERNISVTHARPFRYLIDQHVADIGLHRSVSSPIALKRIRYVGPTPLGVGPPA